MYHSGDKSLTVHAHAKLNLFLKVLGKRDDGFHEIETVMQLIDLHDTLSFRRRDDSRITLNVRQVMPVSPASEVKQEDIPCDEKNLVVQAAMLLRSHTGIEHGVDITLLKRIPSQAGLGGGSSDAATTFNALNQLWELGLSVSDRCQLAAQLGSDIPFFVTGARMGICTGRGETIQPIASRKMYYVLVKPLSGLSAAEVYANCAPSTFSQSAKDSLKGLHEPNIQTVESSLFYNSLERPARRLNLDVQHVLEQLEHEPFVSTMMSGSGTTCFGLCRSRRQSFQLARKLRGTAIGNVYVAQSGV